MVNFKLKAAHSGRLVEVFGGGTSDGDNIDQFDDNNQNNGQWKLNPPGSTQAMSVIALNENIDIFTDSNPNGIILYPNPATNSITLKNVPPNELISILDLNGKILIKKNSGKKDVIAVDITDLKPAVYFVRVGKEGHPTLKFIKK